MKNLFLFILVVMVLPAKAITYTWNGSISTNAGLAANWTPNGLPSNTDNVIIVSGGNICQMTASNTVNNLTLTSGTLDLGGYLLTATGNAVFSGGTVTNGNLSVNGSTANTCSLSGTLFSGTLNLNAVTGNISLGGGTYNGTVLLQQTGTSNSMGSGGAIFNRSATIANSGTAQFTCAGNLTFNSDVTVLNKGTASSILLDNSFANIFNSTVTFTNNSTNNLYACFNGANQFYGSVFVNNTSTGYIHFGNGSSPASYLNSGATISVGAVGYNSGFLTLNRLTQTGTDPVTLSMGTNASLYLTSNTTFSGNTKVTAGNIYVQGATFNDSVTFTKTGGINNNNNGKQNIFNSSCTINQQSNTGYFMLSLGSSDQFNGDIIVNGPGTGAVNIGSGLAGSNPVLAAGKTIKVGAAGFSGGSLSLGALTQLGTIPITLNFPGTSTLVLGYGSTFNAKLYLTAASISVVGNVFNDTVSFTKTGGFDNSNAGYLNTFNSACYINQQSTTGHFILGQNSNDAFNGDVYVTSNGGAYIYLGYFTGSGKPVMAAGKTIRNGAAPFNNGGLMLCQFTQSGTEPVNLTFSGSNAQLNFDRSTMGGNITSLTPSIIFNNSVFKGTVNSTKTGAVVDASPGKNMFQQNLRLCNNSGGALSMGNGSADSCMANADLVNSGTSNLIFALSASGHYVAQNLNITNSASANTVTICNMASSTLNIGGNLTAVNSSTAASSNILLAQYGRLYVLGNSNLQLSTNSSNGQMYVALEAGSVFENTGNFTLNNNSTGSYSSASVAHSGVVRLLADATFTNSALSTSNSFIYAGYYGSSSMMVNGNTIITNNAGSAYAAIIISRIGNVVFNGLLDVLNAPTGSSGEIIFANNAGCLVTVNGISHFTNGGSNVSKRITIGNSGSVIFNSVLNILNQSSASNSEIFCNYSGSNNYNDDIYVESTNASSDGILFGSSGGYGTLNYTKKIIVGANGFIAGQLLFRNFTQLGNTLQNVTITGTGWFSNYDSNWGGDVIFKGARMDTRGTLYNRTAFLEKTGATGDVSAGLNKFMMNAELRNTGSAGFTMGNAYVDSAFQNLIISNMGSSDMAFANNYRGHYIGGDLAVNNSGSGASNTINLSCYNGSPSSHTSLYVKGNTIITNSSTATSSSVTSGVYGDVTYNGTLDVINSSTSNSSTINFGGQNTSLNTMNGITTFLNASTAGTGAVYLGFSGRIIFNNAITCTNAAGGTSGIFNVGYNGTATITAMGNAVFTNAATATSSSFMIGWYADVTFNGTLNCNNQATGNTGSFVLASTSSSDITVNGASSFVNSGGGTTKQMYIGASGNITFNGNMSILNNSTATSSQVYANHSGINLYNQNMVLESTTSLSRGILFGQSGSGTGTLAAGKTITIGPGGYFAGSLLFRRFTQLGTGNIALTLSGTSWFSNYDSQWNADVLFKSPQIDTKTTIYNATAYLEKTGAVNDNSYGGNTFNGNATIANSGTQAFITGNTLGDDFNANATYIKTGTGLNQPAYGATSTYSGNIYISSPTVITFAQYTNGRVWFDGTSPQSINDLGASAVPVFTRLTTNNMVSEITLNKSINISVDLSLLNGNIISNSTNSITMMAGSAVSNVSDNAFVDGPCRKAGNTAFIFPIGNNGYYRKLGVGATTNVNNIYTAQYFESDPHSIGHNKALTLHHISNCEYWTLTKAAGAENTVTTLSYRDFDNSNGCSGVVDQSSLVVAGWNGSLWGDLGASALTGTAADGTINPSAILTTYGALTLATRTGGNPLPVELLSFNATLIEDKVKLEWSTASERNNDYFTIQSSDDGLTFEDITIVDGAGSSNSTLNYMSWDEKPHHGISYYRLKQTDFDGSFTYSEARQINVLSSGTTAVYPNPFTDKIRIEKNTNSPVQLTITNAAGQIICKEMTKDNTLEVNTGKLPAGVYFLKVSSPAENRILKMVKN